MPIAYLERFGSVFLPTLDAETDIHTDDTLPSLELAPHGAIDIYEGDTAPGAPTLLGAGGILYADGDMTALQARFDELRGLRGKRDVLFMRMGDGTVRWKYARMRQLSARRLTDSPYALRVDLVFEAMPTIWHGNHHGPAWTFDDGYAFDTGLTFDAADEFQTMTDGSPHVYTITNAGNRVTEDAIIFINAGSGNTITSVTVATGNAEWTYTGDIEGGGQLMVDTGAHRVTNDLVDAYEDFELTANHTEPTWFPIQPGDNEITVTFVGGGTNSGIAIYFHDGWH